MASIGTSILDHQRINPANQDRQISLKFARRSSAGSHRRWPRCCSKALIGPEVNPMPDQHQQDDRGSASRNEYHRDDQQPHGDATGNTRTARFNETYFAASTEPRAMPRATRRSAGGSLQVNFKAIDAQVSTISRNVARLPE